MFHAAIVVATEMISLDPPLKPEQLTLLNRFAIANRLIVFVPPTAKHGMLFTKGVVALGFSFGPFT